MEVEGHWLLQIIINRGKSLDNARGTYMNTMPVSYTHLDVYKRQMHYLLWLEPGKDSEACLVLIKTNESI